MDLERAVDAAVAAAASPALADAGRRARALREIAGRLVAAEQAIVEVCGAETGLPEARLRTETERTAVQLRLFADHVEAGEHLGAIVDLPDPDARPVPRPDLRRVLVPIGPVAVFGASNFPLAFSTAGGDTAAALAAGCPVIVKGHPAHPGTGELVAGLVHEGIAAAGLPVGTFANLLSADHGLGEALVDHPAIEAVAFTGSIRGGTALFQRAAARLRPIPVFAEMGSVNPVVVTPAAARERADDIGAALAAAVASFGGQLCTKPGVVLVPAGPHGERLAAALATALDAREPEVLLNEGICDAFARSIGSLDGLDGVERLTRAPRRADEGFAHSPVALRASSSAIDRFPGLLEEHFGPAVVLLAYEALEELPLLLERLGGQLTATIHRGAGEGDELAALVGACARFAGRILFDGVPTGVSVTWAMQHGGPWPASSAPATTSVGLTAIERFLRPVVYQSAPAELLPPALRDENPLGVLRRVNGELTREPLAGERGLA